MPALAHQPGKPESIRVDVKGITTHPNVKALVTEMLRLAGLEGSYSLRMTTKLPSHGGRNDLSVKVKGIEPSAVRIVVQCSTDNGGRYEGYLTADGGLRPKELYERLMVRIVGGEYVRTEKTGGGSPKGNPVVRFPDQSLPERSPTSYRPQTAYTEPKVSGKPAASLAGYADDLDLVVIILKSICEKHADGEFPPESFHEIVKTECRDTTNKSAGQLLRRLVDKGHLSSRETDSKTKLYRMSPEGLALAGHNPSLKKGIAPDIMDKALKLQDLAARVKAYQASVQEMSGVEDRMRACKERIGEIEQQLSSARSELSSLEEQARAIQGVLDDPSTQKAVADFERITAVLG